MPVEQKLTFNSNVFECNKLFEVNAQVSLFKADLMRRKFPVYKLIYPKPPVRNQAALNCFPHEGSSTEPH